MVKFQFVVCLMLSLCATVACAQHTHPDYEREKRWAEQTLDSLVVGDPFWVEQRNGHKFLTLYTEADNARGAVVVAHGRGWAPDHELYGQLRMMLAEAGYSTLSIQMPVLDGTAKLGDYLPVFPDAAQRIALATDWLRKRGHARVGVVSHSIGATMTNYYLIRNPDHRIDAWVFVSIINGLEDMFRIHIPVLDVFGSNDWDITRHGADERLKQIVRISGSQQVEIPDAGHFFEGTEEQLRDAIVAFLNNALSNK